jgi:lyzozyme M1 (1,4-beta-N-acetylmuramidase)
MRKFLIMILCFFACSCASKSDILVKEEKNYDISYNSNNFNVYSKVQLKDIIDDENIELLNGDDYVDTDTLGEKKFTLKYLHDGKKYKKVLNYTITDNDKPILINVPSTQTVTLNSEVNPCDKAVFADNYDKKPTCNIEGEYDTKQVGTYNLTYIISDSSNNTVSKKLTFNVIVPSNNTTTTKKPTTTDTKRKKISEAIEQYKNDNTMIGIDVSRYQENIDFEKVKNSGVEFVIIRIGVQSGAKKDVSIDSYYLENIKKAKEAGLLVGVYLYSTAISPEIAKEQAKWVIKTLDGVKLDFPIAFDWENWQYFREYEISLYDLSKSYLSFAKEIEKNGYKAMLYGSKYYLENMWLDKGNYPVWLAHYTDKTNYSGDHIMWQYSAIGEVDGINNAVDLDVYYK